MNRPLTAESDPWISHVDDLVSLSADADPFTSVVASVYLRIRVRMSMTHRELHLNTR